MARSYRGAGTIRWGAQDGKDGVNYLIMGWWSASVHYKLTDAGIPVVKVEDTSPDKFSVYKLTALQSTLGTFIVSEWEKVKSADFVYMQDAYIERLQAVVITAEYISSILIKTGNLEVLSGAKIAGLNIYENAIASYPNLGGIVPPGQQIHVSKKGVLVSQNVGMSQNTVISGTEVAHDGIRLDNSDGNRSLEVKIDGIYRNGVKIL